MILEFVWVSNTQKKLKLNADQKYNKYYWFTPFFNKKEATKND